MAAVAEALPGVLRRPTGYTGWWSWVTTVDHKRIGILYGTTAFIMFLIGGIQALLMRIQLAVPDNRFMDPDTFNALFTMHGTTMIFLVVMPLSAAFFNFIVPLMIGARDVAFPRLNAFSYWIFLAGALMLNISFFAGGAPDTGWFGYANLTTKPYSPGPGVDFWVLGLQILGVSSLAAALNFIITIINMRAPGMSMMRMPLFVWMTLVTTFLLILAFPVITVALILLLFDRFFGTLFYNAGAGASILLWQHLFWVFGHPEVYILILPAMGIVSEVLPTFARKPLFGYPVVVYSGIAIGFMSFGVWSHHMFSVGLGPIADAVFAVNTMAIAVPTGVKIFNWIATLWGGSINMKTALYFAVGFIAMFIIGGLSGVTHASPPADLQQTDTYYIVAHFHYVLFGGSLMGLFAGIYYWFPKMSGRLLDERLGKWHFWLVFVGFNLTFFPMHFTGMLGMPRRVYTYGPELGLGALNMASTVGAFILGLSTLVLIWNVLESLRRGERAGSDPWDGATLEWATASPPALYNFATIPVVHGRDAFWAQKYPDGMHRAVPVTGGAHVTAGTASASEHEPGGEGHGIHMPSPSYFPPLIALGLFMMALGVLFGFAISAVGLLIVFVGICGWALEPAAA